MLTHSNWQSRRMNFDSTTEWCRMCHSSDNLCILSWVNQVKMFNCRERISSLDDLIDEKYSLFFLVVLFQWIKVGILRSAIECSPQVKRRLHFHRFDLLVKMKITFWNPSVDRLFLCSAFFFYSCLRTCFSPLECIKVIHLITRISFSAAFVTFFMYFCVFAHNKCCTMFQFSLVFSFNFFSAFDWWFFVDDNGFTLSMCQFYCISNQQKEKKNS